MSRRQGFQNAPKWKNETKRTFSTKLLEPVEGEGQLESVWLKFSGGGKGGDTFKTPSPLRTTFAFTHPCFKMFSERSLNDPPPPLPQLKHLSLLPFSPPTTPPWPKNFNHTLKYHPAPPGINSCGIVAVWWQQLVSWPSVGIRLCTLTQSNDVT